MKYSDAFTYGRPSPGVETEQDDEGAHDYQSTIYAYRY